MQVELIEVIQDMKRFSHIIKKNKDSEMPTHVIFFDTETTEIHNIEDEDSLV